jgi:hypothetical protein
MPKSKLSTNIYLENPLDISVDHNVATNLNMFIYKINSVTLYKDGNKSKLKRGINSVKKCFRINKILQNYYKNVKASDV